jgi:uncharacterized membrane protein HdeD (DUF308 family)
MRKSVAPGWLGLRRGLASIAVGVAALVWPQRTLELLLRLIGGFVIVTGLLAVAGGARRYDKSGVWRPWLC